MLMYGKPDNTDRPADARRPQGQRDDPERDQPKNLPGSGLHLALESGTSEGSPAQILGITRAIDAPIAQIYDNQDET